LLNVPAPFDHPLCRGEFAGLEIKADLNLKLA
jgi:hypothetical protein